MTASTPKRRFRFTLRMLLMFVTFCAVLCGWIAVRMQKAKNQQEAVEAIRKAGGQVYYFPDKQNSDGNEFVGEELPRGVWLQSFVGRARVFQVSFSDTKTKVSDAELQHVKELPDLQHLFVDGTQITDAGLAYIEGLSELEVLYLDFTKVTDAGLEHIHDLPRLRFVSLDNTRVTGAGFRYFKGLSQLQDLSMDDTKVTDAALPYLKALPQLQDLSLKNTQVTDIGLQYIGGLPRLKVLRLGGTSVTDAGLRHLETASQLAKLEVNDTKVTVEGVKRLKRALSNCGIFCGIYIPDVTGRWVLPPEPAIPDTEAHEHHPAENSHRRR